MATLTNEDFTFYKHAIRRDPVAKEEMTATAMGKPKVHALFQGLNDWYESERLNAKAAMEAEAGISITNQLAKKIAKVWMDRKFRGE